MKPDRIMDALLAVVALAFLAIGGIVGFEVGLNIAFRATRSEARLGSMLASTHVSCGGATVRDLVVEMPTRWRT